MMTVRLGSGKHETEERKAGEEGESGGARAVGRTIGSGQSIQAVFSGVPFQSCEGQ